MVMVMVSSLCLVSGEKAGRRDRQYGKRLEKLMTTRWIRRGNETEQVSDELNDDGGERGVPPEWWRHGDDGVMVSEKQAVWKAGRW